MSQPGSAIDPVAVLGYEEQGQPDETLTVGQVIRRLSRFDASLPVVFGDQGGTAFGVQDLGAVPMRREITDTADSLDRDVYRDDKDVPALCDCYEEPRLVILLQARVSDGSGG